MKKSKVIFGVTILTSLILIAIFSLSSKDMSEEKWLKKNSTSLDIKDNDDFSTFNILKEDLENNQVFLTGEYHKVNVNDDLDLKFLKYFKKEANIKYYLVETNYCNSIILNEYLKTGDKSCLDRLIKNPGYSQFINKQSYKKWQEIYKFNSKLSEKEKIKVIGIDINTNPLQYFEYLNTITSKLEIPPEAQKTTMELNNDFESFKKDPYYSYLKLEESVLRVKNDIKENENLYKKFIKEDFKEFTYVLDNLYYNLHWLAMGEMNDDAMKYREKRMYENFNRVYSTLEKGKYYGHFGAFHVYQIGDNLASFMNNGNSPVKDKVLSIETIYENSETLMLKSNDDGEVEYEKIKINANKNLIDLIKPFKKSDLMMFRLSGKGSPFYRLKDYKYFQEGNEDTKKELEKAPLIRYFQYLVVVYNAKSIEPFKN
ncbi:hypothetical protein [Clostridium sp. KNHs214]|uniref:hypothetical protein n=1 Tax=Clostridium sp. KNHs214 TaxID=1540257 RepID=UPI00054DEA7A|nr:hypothetical protein [Clostridium sp. KNHs214]